MNTTEATCFAGHFPKRDFVIIWTDLTGARHIEGPFLSVSDALAAEVEVCARKDRQRSVWAELMNTEANRAPAPPSGHPDA